MNIQIFRRYTLQGMALALNTFNFPDDHTHIQKVMGFRFLLTNFHHARKEIPPKKEIFKKIWEILYKNGVIKNEENISKEENKGKRDYTYKYTQVIDNEKSLKDISLAMEFVDVMLEFDENEGKKLLEILEKSKAVLNENSVKIDGPENTIYSNAQSVHKLSKKYAKIASNICKDYPVPRPDTDNAEDNDKARALREKLFEMAKSALMKYISEDLIDKYIDRFQFDNAVYYGYFLDDIFLSLWVYIYSNKYKESMVMRLGEEFLEMNNYCSSGLLSHIINSIQGITDKEEYTFYMDVEDQCKGVVYNYIDKLLQEIYNRENGEERNEENGKNNDERNKIYTAIEDVIINGDDCVKENKNIYKNFILSSVNNKKSEWSKYYGNKFIKLVDIYTTEYLNK